MDSSRNCPRRLRINRAQSPFPAELLEEIFSYLVRSDLTRVSRVNRLLCSASRKLLYTSIDLSSDDAYVYHTLRLLSADLSLCSIIESARLQTQPQARPRRLTNSEAWINPNIFKDLTRLKALRLVGYPFRGASMWQFQDVLRQNFQSLSEIVFEPNADLEIAGIMGVQWGLQSTTAEFKLQPGFLWDISSVTHLSFGGTVIHNHSHPFSTILQQIFPCLRSLELGSLTLCDEPVWSRQSVTQFLLNHPRIQHLSFGTERPTRYIFFDLHRPSVSPGILPELRGFEGFPENLVAMAGAQCLDLVQSLAIVSDTRDDELREMEAMFHSLSGRTLTSVKRLHVELYSELSHRMHSNVTFLPHVNCMQFGFANLCPNVTDIYAKLAPLHGDMIARLFSGYEHLESLSLPLFSLSLNMSANEIEFFGPIAQQCPKLKVIKARRPGFQNEYNVFSLLRDEEGNLVKVNMSVALG